MQPRRVAALFTPYVSRPVRVHPPPRPSMPPIAVPSPVTPVAVPLPPLPVTPVTVPLPVTPVVAPVAAPVSFEAAAAILAQASADLERALVAAADGVAAWDSYCPGGGPLVHLLLRRLPPFEEAVIYVFHTMVSASPFEEAASL